MAAETADAAAPPGPPPPAAPPGVLVADETELSAFAE
jgi:hypothetical protein